LKPFQEWREGRQRRMMEGMNLTMIYCRNFCKCHNVPQHNNNMITNNIKNVKIFWPKRSFEKKENAKLRRSLEEG
jgi:hypothetical protein